MVLPDEALAESWPPTHQALEAARGEVEPAFDILTCDDPKLVADALSEVVPWKRKRLHHEWLHTACAHLRTLLPQMDPPDILRVILAFGELYTKRRRHSLLFQDYETYTQLFQALPTDVATEKSLLPLLRCYRRMGVIHEPFVGALCNRVVEGEVELNPSQLSELVQSTAQDPWRAEDQISKVMCPVCFKDFLAVFGPMQIILDSAGALRGRYLTTVQVGQTQSSGQSGPRSHFDFPSVSGTSETAQVAIYRKVGTCTVEFNPSAAERVSCQVQPEGELKTLDLTLQSSPAQSDLSWNNFFGWCNSSAESADTAASVSAVPVSEGAVVVPYGSGPRMLVLTDVGEEIDDEAALWLLHQHLNASPTLEADIVFVTGSPLERATRWAQVLNSLPENHVLTERIQYYVGPTTSRHMRYRMMADAAELLSAGLATLINKPFLGGEYDVVLQISPISGFSSDFANPPTGPLGALAHVVPRPGAKGLTYIVVGGEGATNFPRDELHIGFKKYMQEKGFAAVHVEKANYLNWEKAMFETFPPKLTELVLDDEWNKAVGRIPPMVANLFVRFRVNTLVNYEVVDRAFAAFEEDLRGTPDYVRATKWFMSVEKKVLQNIRETYVKISRESDNKSKDCFGNGAVSEKVKGMKMSWESICSRVCVRDILASTDITETTFSKQTVDDILGYAITHMTSKLLKIYAFNRYVSGRDPDIAQLEPYLLGTKDTSAMDFRNFPELHGDISAIQKEVVGNPMYDPAGMLVGLVLMSADEEQAWHGECGSWAGL
ncbi:unnamed protein product [Symbiodinium natans]|uniref:Uncharacterized protein n=1 Tax=Symbiodinium natans TaxID=878477 RepID=A0A812LXA6_9DINO|nr:unnamed protein product [Symbiodinium natans]